MWRKDTQKAKDCYFGGVKVYMILIMFLVSGTAFAHPWTPELKPMEHYYYVGEKALSNGINCMVITNRKQMEKIFGRINRPDTPHFANENLLVMVMPETRKDTKLSYRASFVKAGNFLAIYCKVNHTKHTLTYTHYPIATAVVPKYKGVNQVYFYEERKKTTPLIEKVALPERL